MKYLVYITRTIAIMLIISGLYLIAQTHCLEPDCMSPQHLVQGTEVGVMMIFGAVIFGAVTDGARD